MGGEKTRAANPGVRRARAMTYTYPRARRVPHGQARPDCQTGLRAPSRPAAADLPVPAEEGATKLSAGTRIILNQQPGGLFLLGRFGR